MIDGAQCAPETQTPRLSAAICPQGPSETAMRAVTVFVAGSIRTTVLRLGTVAQIAPAPATRNARSPAACAGASRIVATTRFVVGSMRDTLGPKALTTQTEPAAIAAATGYGPTGMVAATLSPERSMRDTALSDARGIQTAPAPTAGSPQTYSGHGLRDSTLILAAARLPTGLIRVSVETASLIDQTAPSPTARPPDPSGIRTFAITVPPRGSAAFSSVAATPATLQQKSAARLATTVAVALCMVPPRSATCSIEAPRLRRDLGDCPEIRSSPGETLSAVSPAGRCARRDRSRP